MPDQQGGSLNPNLDLGVTGYITATGPITSSSLGIGYAAGAGGTVTQLTDKSTAVTLNKITGAVTMNNASLAAAAEATFTVNNSLVTATDAIIVNHASAGTAGSYLLTACGITAGAFQITVSNASAGALAEAIVVRYVVIKAVSA